MKREYVQMELFPLRPHLTHEQCTAVHLHLSALRDICKQLDADLRGHERPSSHQIDAHLRKAGVALQAMQKCVP